MRPDLEPDGDGVLANVLSAGIVFLLSCVLWQACAEAQEELGCEKILKSHDGAYTGFLWKQSEPACCGRGAVTFLPKKYAKKIIPAKKVYVLKDGKKIATAYERKVYEDGRPFWRFHKLAKKFPLKVVVHFDKICVFIKNPKVRND